LQMAAVVGTVPPATSSDGTSAPSLSAEALAHHSIANQSRGCERARVLFAPLSCRTFVNNYFEQRHHLARNTGVNLLSSAELPLLAEHWQFKVAVDHSQARLLLPDSFSHDPAYTEGQLLTGNEIPRALRNNRTLVLHNVELYWRPIGALALTLMQTFGVYSQANVYYAAAGLDSAVHAHQDAQSVFIVQCEGRKRWQLFAPPQRWRLRYNQRGKAGDIAPSSELTQPLDDVVLSPGDVLFVPRGTYHRTSTFMPRKAPEAEATRVLADDDPAGGPASLHVTIGIETDTDEWIWLSLLREAAEALELLDATRKLDAAQWHDEELREALPLELCRPSASFDTRTPFAAGWLAHARTLIKTHLKVSIDAEKLRTALDNALRSRQDLVERKRLQVEQFLPLSPALPNDATLPKQPVSHAAVTPASATWTHMPAAQVQAKGAARRQDEDAAKLASSQSRKRKKKRKV